ncbi:MAG: protein kinase [Planctomycetales bacterium]|nr:protein kinase [Planctomycetales bacterium]
MKTRPAVSRESENYLRLLRAQIEHRVRAGERWVTRQVLAEHPQFRVDPESVLDLVYSEISVLDDLGAEVDVNVLVRDFPELSSRIRGLLEVHYSLKDGPPDPDDDPSPRGLQNQTNVRLEVLEELGRGGMGIVYRARQLGTGRIIAVKTIRVADPDASTYKRFKQEAESAAKLQHPNIVQIFEVGEMQGRPYLAMEYMEGGGLDQSLARQPLSTSSAVEMLIKLCAAIHFAHQQGIVHRDLKPANILLTRTGEPKVSDFGVAKCLDSPQQIETQSGALLGTPAYMAPEQTEAGAEPCLSSDVYSLGAILYEMCCGRAPFHANTLLETLQQVRTHEPMSLRKLVPDIARDLETICLKCLEKNPTLRYAGADELADDLRRFQAGEAIHAVPANLWEIGLKQIRRRPQIAALVMTTLVVAAIGILGIAWQWRRANWQTQVAIKQKVAAVEHQRRAERSRDDALKAVRQADRNFRKAERLVESLLELSSQLQGRPGSESLRQVALGDAIDAFSEFAEGQQLHPSLSRLISRAQLRLAELQQMSGRYRLADETFQRGIQLADLVVSKLGSDNEYLLAAADAHFRYGTFVMHTTRNTPAAIEQFQIARELYSQVVLNDPQSTTALDRLGETLGTICFYGTQPLESDESGDMLARALELQIQGLRFASQSGSSEKLVRWAEQEPWKSHVPEQIDALRQFPRLESLSFAKQLFSLSITMDHIGERQRRLGNLPTALDHLQTALGIRDYLQPVLVGDHQFDLWHARSHSRIARVLYHQEKMQLAAESMALATDRFTQLHTLNPIHIEITKALVYCFFQSATMQDNHQKDSIPLLVEQVDGLMEQYDTPADHRHEFDRQLSVHMRLQGEWLLASGYPLLAEVSLRHANQLASRLHGIQPDEHLSIADLIQARCSWANTLMVIGSPDAAMEHARDALRLCAVIESRFPQNDENVRYRESAESIVSMIEPAADVRSPITSSTMSLDTAR